MIHLPALLLTSLLTAGMLPSDDAAAIAAQLPSYPLDTCVVSGEALEADSAIEVVHEGRLVRVCCKGCIKKVPDAAEKILGMIDRAVVKAQKADYPMKTCPMTGKNVEKTGLDVVVGTRLVRVCCGKCAKKVETEPATALALLDTAYIKAQLADYPLKTCLISDEMLDRGAKNIVHGNRLVRLCCNGCKRKFAEAPGKFLAMLDAARSGHAPRDAAHGHDEGGHEGGHDGGHDGGHEGDHGES